MKKLIVLEEQEFEDKFMEFCNNFIDESKKGWGAKLISNETNDTQEGKHFVYGYFHSIWLRTFNI